MVGTLEWAPDRCTIGGVLHGGALMNLADSLGAILAYLNLPEGAIGTTTIESKTNLFRAVREGTATATTTVLHAGRTVIVVQTDVRDHRGKRVSLTTQTQAVLRGLTITSVSDRTSWTARRSGGRGGGGRGGRR